MALLCSGQPGKEAEVDLSLGGEHVVVLRRGDDLEMHRLDDASFALLSRLREGSTLESAFDTLTNSGNIECNDGGEPDLSAALHSVMALGLLSGFVVTAPISPSTQTKVSN